MAIARYKWLVILVVVTGLAMALRLALHDSAPWVAAAVAIAVMLAAFFLLRKDWEQHDEASKEAHKTSWYWGAIFGIVLSGITLSLMMANRESLGQLPAIGPADPLGYFAAGALATMLVQLLCYLVAWGGWWISKR